MKCEIQLDWFHAKTIGGVDLAGIKMAGGENTAAQVPMDVAKDENAPTGEADGKVDKITALQDAIGKTNCRALISHHSFAQN